MKTVYAHSALFRFMNFIAIILSIIVIIFALLFNESELWYMLIVSAFFISMSFLLLINRIQYDDQTIKILFATKKKNFKYSEIKEIYYRNHLIKGCEVVINLDFSIDDKCDSAYIYAQKCKELEIINIFSFGGIRKKDLFELLANFNGYINSDEIDIKKNI